MTRAAVRSVSLSGSLSGLREKNPALWSRLVDGRAIRISVQAEQDFLEGRAERGEAGLKWLLLLPGYLSRPLARPVIEARERMKGRLLYEGPLPDTGPRIPVVYGRKIPLHKSDEGEGAC